MAHLVIPIPVDTLEGMGIGVVAVKTVTQTLVGLSTPPVASILPTPLVGMLTMAQHSVTTARCMVTLRASAENLAGYLALKQPRGSETTSVKALTETPSGGKRGNQKKGRGRNSVAAIEASASNATSEVNNSNSDQKLNK